MNIKKLITHVALSLNEEKNKEKNINLNKNYS